MKIRFDKGYYTLTPTLYGRNVAMYEAGQSAGICTASGSIEELMAEPTDTTMNRYETTQNRGHHSVMGHAHLQLIIEDAPKIVLMLLNNEKEYNTSERSGRFTRMTAVSEEENNLYSKWESIFIEEMDKSEQKFGKVDKRTKAQENARYVLSWFTPTTMKYTTSMRQLHYIVDWALTYNDKADTEFQQKVAPYMVEFGEICSQLLKDIKAYDERIKDPRRTFSLFTSAEDALNYSDNHYGSSYTFRYEASVSSFAQIQRNRCISCKIYLPANKESWSYYIPKIIRGNEALEREWIDDLNSIRDKYPQATLLDVVERGNIDTIVMKAHERMCGQAQLETMDIVNSTLEEYRQYTSNDLVLKELDNYCGRTRCNFLKDARECEKPCAWGKEALKRFI